MHASDKSGTLVINTHSTFQQQMAINFIGPVQSSTDHGDWGE